MKKHEHENREPKSPEREDGEHPYPHLGTERRAHVAIVRRWWEGSEPPSAQAYARALKQWRQLPGSIVTTATDIAAVTAVINSPDPKQPR
jgi:hypothetical protein